ncbi:MAG TPA: hypothetical protein VIM58_08305 [Candidatus Methylacidiphilales bacterium]
MRFPTASGLLASLLCFIASPAARADDDALKTALAGDNDPKRSFIFTFEAAPAGNYARARFEGWCQEYPPNEPLQYVVVLTDSNATGSKNDPSVGGAVSPAWKKWASDHHSAIVTTDIYGTAQSESEKSDHPSWEASGGSGDALVLMLDEFGKAFNRPEIYRIPLILIGRGTRGQFAYEFAQWRPTRVAAFVVWNGKPTTRLRAPTKDSLHVPGLFVYNQYAANIPYAEKLVEEWAAGRSLGAPWGLAPANVKQALLGPLRVPAATNPRAVDAVTSFLPDLLSSFLDEALSSPQGTGKAWIGDPHTGTISAATDDDAALALSWFPGEATAKSWAAVFSPTAPLVGTATSAAAP